MTKRHKDSVKDTSTTRRRFLKVAAAGAATTVAAPAALAQSGPINMRFQSTWPAKDIFHEYALDYAKKVNDMTGGDLKIEVLPAGAVVPAFQLLEAVSKGTLDGGHGVLAYHYGKSNALALWGSGPAYAMDANMLLAWHKYGGGKALLEEVYKSLNLDVVSYLYGPMPTQPLGWFKKPVAKADDMKGLKFRIGGIGGQVLAKLGVVPQQIAPGDVYPSLERGTLDAAEFVGPYDDEKLGLVKVAKYYYYPGWWEGGAMLHLVIAQEQWDKLPKHYQAILANACEAANNWMLAKYDAVNPPALRKLVQQGAELRAFPQSIMEAGYRASFELYNEIAGQNAAFKKAYDSMMAMRTEQLVWWQIAEYSFDSFNIRMRGRS